MRTSPRFASQLEPSSLRAVEFTSTFREGLNVKIWDGHFLHFRTFGVQQEVQGEEIEKAGVRSYQYVCGTNCCSDMAGRTYVGSNWRRGSLSFLGV